MTFIKWAGGKTWLWKEAPSLFTENQLPYVEPFAGGGAIFLGLLEQCDKHKIKREFYINDLNKDLMDTYKYIKEDVEGLMEAIDKIESDYYANRDDFNEMEPCIEKAALFIWLNKRCYRGLYRINSRGKFSTPIGSYNTPIYKSSVMREYSRLFNKFDVHFSNLDYEQFLSDKTNCMIYLDPPYYKTYDSYLPYKFEYERFNNVLNTLLPYNHIILSNNSFYQCNIKECLKFTQTDKMSVQPKPREEVVYISRLTS